MSVDIQKLAKTVLNAQRSGTAIPQLSETESFTLEEAYRVQVQSIEYRKVEGEHRVGMKMGFTRSPLTLPRPPAKKDPSPG